MGGWCRQQTQPSTYRGTVQDETQEFPDQNSPTPDPTPVHRAPRVLPFVLIGTVLGVALAGLVTVMGPSSPMYSPGRSFAFLAVMFGIAGLLLGGVVFAIVDAIALKRSERRGS